MAIIRIRSTVLSPRNWIYVRARPGHAAVPRYGIVQRRTSSQGTTVCFSGQTSGTRCGPITGLGLTFTVVLPDGSRRQIRNLGEFDACVQGGDSGGPVFITGGAYGNIHGRPQDTCTALYQGLLGATGAEAHMRVTVRTS